MSNGSDRFKLGILTSSDAGAKGERPDTSGDVIESLMTSAGFELILREILPDDRGLISSKLIEWCDGDVIDVLMTTGGTGLGPRDVMPEATLDVIEFEVPGITEAMRMETFRITPMAMLSRSVAGVRSGCLIVNLPGSPKGVRETLDVAIKGISHGLEMLRGHRGHPTD